MILLKDWIYAATSAMNSSQKPSIVFLFVIYAALFMNLDGETQAEETPLRVAIIDTSDQLVAPPALLDLLVVELSQKEGFAVLERQEIATVLSEQQRNLAIAGDASQDDLVAAGQIFGADALVLISAAEALNPQGLQAIEARIVETRRGVRFGKTVFAWSKDGQAIAKQISSATEQIVGRLGRIHHAQGKFTLVSLAGFRTGELSQEAHRFKRNLEAWLETWLASKPGIAVAERTKVLPLITERKLSDDLPAALGEADVTIDGTFRLDFSQAQPQVELAIRVIRKDRTVATRILHAPISEQAKLREAAGKVVLELLSIKATESFDAKTEAKLLTNEAERLLALRRRYEALDRLMTAYALNPDSLRTQMLLLNAARRIGVGPDPSGASFEGPFYSTALFVGDIARQLLDQIRDKRIPQSELELYQRDNLIGRIGEFCSLMSQTQFVVKKPTESQTIQHEWLRMAVDDLFSRYLDLLEIEGGRNYESAIYTGLRCGRYWAKGPEEALDQRYQLFQRAADLSQEQGLRIGAFGNCQRFRLSDNKAWAVRDDLHQLYESYIQKMQESEHVTVQAVGEREAANYSLWELKDRTRAMKHYRGFIQLIVKEIIPNHPQLADQADCLWLNLNQRTGSLALTDAEAGELWSQVIIARWSPERKCPQSSQNWEGRIKVTMLHLEKAGEIEKAGHLLQECIAALQASPIGLEPHKISNRWQGTLRRLQEMQLGLGERHPQLGGEASKTIPTLAVVCKSLFHCKQIPELLNAKHVPVHSWRFSGLATTTEGYAVICLATRSKRSKSGKQSNRRLSQEWLAVIRLDKSGVLKSTSLFPEPMEYDSRSSRLTGIIIPAGDVRPTAAAEGNIFVSVPLNGIVWFPPNEAPIHFSSKYLNQLAANRRPVPFEEARHLVPIDGKIYFHAGKDPFRPRIYELDYQQGESRILLDTRSLPEESPLKGRRGFAMTSGPPGKLLVWSFPDGGPRNGKRPRLHGGHLFLLDLQNGSVEQAEHPFRLGHAWVRNGAQHHLGMRTEEGQIAVFNQQTLSIDSLLGDQPVSLRSNSRTRLSSQEFVYNAPYLFTSAKKPGRATYSDLQFLARGLPKKQTLAASNWLLYKKGSATPQRLQSDLLPPPVKVSKYFMNDQGQILMLTSNEVFRIELPAKDNP